jgi:hypothetical protein
MYVFKKAAVYFSAVVRDSRIYISPKILLLKPRISVSANLSELCYKFISFFLPQYLFNQEKASDLNRHRAVQQKNPENLKNNYTLVTIHIFSCPVYLLFYIILQHLY